MKESITVRLSEGERRLLEGVCVRQDVTISELVRRILSDYVDAWLASRTYTAQEPADVNVEH